MLFSFAFPPYTAMVGDMVRSKTLQDRKAVQEKLNAVLCGINVKYAGDIASKFMITLGDEFQGLLRSGTHAAEIAERIEREMHPVKIRFGIGVGEIATDINASMPLGADGSAYYNAREMINELKATEKRKMESKLNMKIAIEDHPDISELINAVFSLNTALKAKWTDRQREIINAYLQNSRTQSEVAKELSINQSTVQKALSSSDFYTYQGAVDAVTKVLSGIKAEQEGEKAEKGEKKEKEGKDV